MTIVATRPKNKRRSVKLTYVRPKMYAYQTAFMDGPERYSVIEASTKVGKTASMIVWLFEQAINGKDGQNFLWLAPVYAQAKVAFKRMIRQGKILDGETGKPFFKVNRSELTLKLPNGAVIVFRSSENPDNLYGDDYYAAVFDEASRASEEANNALRSTVTKTGGKIKYIANVRGRGWYYRLAQKAKNGTSADYAYYKVTCWDGICTGRLDPVEVIANKSVLVEHGVFDKLLSYAQSRKSQTSSKADQQLSLKEIVDAAYILPAHAFRETFEAEPSDDGGNPFGIQNIERQSRPATGEDVVTNLPSVCQGIDLASKQDWTVRIGLSRECRVSAFERFQLDWNRTKELLKQSPDIPTLIDSTGVGAPILQDMQQGRKHTEGFVFSATSKQRLIEALVTAFQTGEIEVPNEGPLYDELLSFEYTFSRTGGVRYSAPPGLHDDCVMALALAYSKYKNRPVPIPRSKARTLPSKRGFQA